VVLTDHNQPTEVRRPSAREWNLTDAVVAVSGHTAEKALARGTPGPVQVILNGVEPVRPARPHAEVRAELGFPPDRVLGVIVARLDRVKGYDVLLEALARLQKDAAPAILALGDGPERPALEQQAAELGLGPDRLRFLGFRSDTPDLLAAGDFFVLPSRNEGLPLSVLEAMGQGLPVIVTPVGGIPEVVADGGQGLMVPVEDVDALAAALDMITRDVALRERLGASALARAHDEFSFEAMARRYEQVYRGEAAD
jgi:glycosyltransferase involved in cell wall biosynthesis